MSKSNNLMSEIQFRKTGIYLREKDGGSRRIADPIKVTAFGVSEPNTAREQAYTAIKFLNRYNEWKREILPSSILTSQQHEFVSLLSRKGYLWPPAPAIRSKIIGELSIVKPERRIRVTPVPGWHGKSFVLPRESYTPGGSDRKRFKVCHHSTVRLGRFRRRGSLEEWQKTIGKSCSHSSRARLAVSAAFTAPNLRPLNVNSFGFNFSGGTSGGKTLLIRLAASAAGLISSEGPATWDGSPTGFEQRALGHRDCIMPLDDLSHLEGDSAQVSKLAKLVTFRLASNRPKTRAGQYVEAHDLVETDWRVIPLSTSEDPLWQPAATTGRGRVRGEEVRMINVRACVSEIGDIFDGPSAATRIGSTMEERLHSVEKLEEFTHECQGEPLRTYLASRLTDKHAEENLKGYVDEYLTRVPLVDQFRPFGRIRRFFAITYASAAQAIDYQILPWGKEATLRDIAKCMSDAMDQLTVVGSASANAQDTQEDGSLLDEFRGQFQKAKFIRLDRSTAKKLKKADGLIRPTGPGKVQYLLYSKTLEAWFPDVTVRKHLTALLRSQGMIKRGRKADTNTRQFYVAPLKKKVSYYATLRKRIVG